MIVKGQKKALSHNTLLGQGRKIVPAVPPGLMKILSHPLMHTIICQSLITEDQLRLPYQASALQFALKSPFTSIISTAIPPAAALYQERDTGYYSFSTVYHATTLKHKTGALSRYLSEISSYIRHEALQQFRISISVQNFYHLDLEVQLFSCHLMVCIQSDGSICFSCNCYREWLTVCISQIYSLANIQIL